MIDLNCDLGEVELENLDEILDAIDAANISCGAHAGDEKLIDKTIKAALARGVKIGAHPSYPDRENFGRVSLKLPLNQLEAALTEQLQFLEELTQQNGATLEYVKAHGALYNDMMDDLAIFEAVMKSCSGRKVMVLGLPDMREFEKLAARYEVDLLLEGFADRGYDQTGRLLARSVSGAVFNETSRILKQVEVLKSKKRVNSICLHGDNPALMKSVKRVKTLLAHDFHTVGVNSFKIIFKQELTLGELKRIASVAEYIRESVPNVYQVIPAFNTIYVEFDLLKWREFELRLKCLDIISTTQFRTREIKEIVLPCYYLPENDLKLSTQELAARHGDRWYKSYAVGFLPGFAYLGDIDPGLSRPRLMEPRTKVPKGSVALANTYTAVYPKTAPGGWNLIGLCPYELFPENKSLIKMGDKVKFQEISKARYLELGGEIASI